MAIRDRITLGIGPGGTVKAHILGGLTQSAVIGFAPHITQGIGPGATIKYRMTGGLNIGAVSTSIPVFMNHYRQQGIS